MDNVFIAPRVTFLNDKYPPSKGKEWKKTIVFNDAVIGGSCTILPGIAIGAGTTVGAGTVVTKPISYDRIAYNKIQLISKNKEKEND